MPSRTMNCPWYLAGSLIDDMEAMKCLCWLKRFSQDMKLDMGYFMILCWRHGVVEFVIKFADFKVGHVQSFLQIGGFVVLVDFL